MAKGAQSKAEVTKVILAAFNGSFLYNDGKEIRIPMIEDGAEVQIKVALTCAKENVESGSDIAMPGDFPAPVNAKPTVTTNQPVAPSDDEKAKVAALFKSLGL